MICGIGIDLIEIARVEATLARWHDRFVQRVFTPEEIAWCTARADRAAAFAVRFAAKEAFAKALGTGIHKNFSWKDFAISNQSNGRPQAVVSSRLAGQLSGIKIHVSLSHSDDYATAVVVLEENETETNFHI
ncbi:MAG: holo-ACP synthase [candidate division KSB1 bacterium]|nr:holo-ACP synthase [candidate division KSB1 bacterium]MDZ7301175.1 holo-ACP synthase [candidate division KSB1 bacterium]MDZ7310601.1 holo-ACP synthase [candidate division KSB1 bacterium]